MVIFGSRGGESLLVVHISSVGFEQPVISFLRPNLSLNFISLKPKERISMLESKRLPREMTLFPEAKQGERGGNSTIIVGLANKWGKWVEVYSYIRPQRVRVILNTLSGESSVLVRGEIGFIGLNGNRRTISVLGDTQFNLDLGRNAGAVRKRVFARFSSSFVPIFRGTLAGVRERVIISKVSNLR